MISVIVITFNATRTIKACLDSLFTHAPATAEIIVVDTGSTDGTLDILRRYSAQGVRLVRGGNHFCFGGASNLASRYASHDILYFHSADAYLTGNVLTEMAACLRAHPRLAVIGPQMIHPDGRVRQTAHAFANPRQWLMQILHVDRLWRGLSRRWTMPSSISAPLQEVDWLSRKGLMIRRQAFQDISGFDSALTLHTEDEDLCRRLHAAGHGIALHHVTAPVLQDCGQDHARSQHGMARLRRAARQMFIDKHFNGHRRWLMHGLLYAKYWLRPD